MAICPSPKTNLKAQPCRLWEGRLPFGLHARLFWSPQPGRRRGQSDPGVKYSSRPGRRATSGRPDRLFFLLNTGLRNRGTASASQDGAHGCLMTDACACSRPESATGCLGGVSFSFLSSFSFPPAFLHSFPLLPSFLLLSLPSFFLPSLLPPSLPFLFLNNTNL